MFLFFISIISSIGFSFDCLELPNKINGSITSPYNVNDDFEYRESLKQTEISKSNWDTCCGSFGPCPLSYPKVLVPVGLNPFEWLQNRVEAVAKKYIGLPYLHKHIPIAGGLDCSNFTAWVFNWGFGVRLSSHVVTQSKSAGKKLKEGEIFTKGDLLFFWNEKKTKIAHVAIFLENNLLIEARGKQVQLKQFKIDKHFAWARRVLSKPAQSLD